MPKTSSKKAQSSPTLAIFGIASRMVRTSTGIPGTKRNVRSGRSARTERTTERFGSVLLGKRMGTHASETTAKSSWHHVSRRYAPSDVRKPNASTLTSSSTVYTPRNVLSHSASSAALGVPGGSSGDSHAMVTTLSRIAVSTIGSKRLDSTRKMAVRRGSVPGRRHGSSEVPRYTRPLGPITAFAAGRCSSPPRSGSGSSAPGSADGAALPSPYCRRDEPYC